MDTKERYEALRAAVKAGGSRYANLAYAYIRQVPYRCLELRVREHNEPHLHDLWDALNGTITSWWKIPCDQKDEMLKDLRAWVEVPAPQLWVDLYEKKRERYLEAKRKRTLEIKVARGEVAP